MNFYIFTDASYRNNRACGAIIIDCNNSLIKRKIYFKCKSSTEAEFLTLSLAIKVANEINIDWPQSRIFVHSDEQYLVDYFNGHVRSPRNIKHLSFDKPNSSMIRLQWIERQQNWRADELCQLC